MTFLFFFVVYRLWYILLHTSSTSPWFFTESLRRWQQILRKAYRQILSWTLRIYICFDFYSFAQVKESASSFKLEEKIVSLIQSVLVSTIESVTWDKTVVLRSIPCRFSYSFCRLGFGDFPNLMVEVFLVFGHGLQQWLSNSYWFNEIPKYLKLLIDAKPRLLFQVLAQSNDMIKRLPSCSFLSFLGTFPNTSSHSLSFAQNTSAFWIPTPDFFK